MQPKLSVTVPSRHGEKARKKTLFPPGENGKYTSRLPATSSFSIPWLVWSHQSPSQRRQGHVHACSCSLPALSSSSSSSALPNPAARAEPSPTSNLPCDVASEVWPGARIACSPGLGQKGRERGQGKLQLQDCRRLRQQQTCECRALASVATSRLQVQQRRRRRRGNVGGEVVATSTHHS